MDFETLKTYLATKPGSRVETPFSPDTLVYKVMGKMFALVALAADPVRVSLKCDPERAIELREAFASIRGAYHMNKKHWNMIDLDGSVPRDELLGMIDDSYDLVVGSLPKARRRELGEGKPDGGKRGESAHSADHQRV